MSSRICAEYVEGEDALAAARKLVDEGVDPQDIEIRSPYPLSELAIPPHRSRPMIMRNVVRFMWCVGAVAGFSFLAWTQLWWGLKTDWHPIVSVPINAVITYECAMITAIWTTTFMFFWETRHYRRLTPPLAEDLPVANGHVVLIVDGAGASKAESVLKDSGYRSLVPFVAMLGLLGLLNTGCGKYRSFDWNKHNMRDQQVIKPTEAASDETPAGVFPMPTRLQQQVPPFAPFGWVTPEELARKKFLQPNAEERAIKDPVPSDALSLANGKRLFDTNCAFCHGKTGQGDGKVGEVYAPKPANLTTNAAIARKPAGEFYHWIVVGKTTMPSFGYRLATVEIFDIINYLRYLQAGNDPEKIKAAVRPVHFELAQADMPGVPEVAPAAAGHGPAAAPSPLPEPSPEPAAPVETPTPEASPSPEAPKASAAQIQAAGIPPAAAEFPGVAEVATMTLDVPASMEAEGKDIYANAGQCASCHGDAGQGNGPAGAGLVPPPRNLTAKAEFKYGTTDKALFRTVAFGVPDTGMAAQWDHAGGALTEEQVKAVVAFVKTLMK